MTNPELDACPTCAAPVSSTGVYFPVSTEAATLRTTNPAAFESRIREIYRLDALNTMLALKGFTPADPEVSGKRAKESNASTR